MSNKIHRDQVALEPVRKLGDELLEKIYKSKAIPMSKMTDMLEVINSAYDAGATKTIHILVGSNGIIFGAFRDAGDAEIMGIRMGLGDPRVLTLDIE